MRHRLRYSKKVELFTLASEKGYTENMKKIILLSLVLWGCNQSKNDNFEGPSSLVKGDWEKVQEVCGTSSVTSSSAPMVSEKVTLTDGNFTAVTVVSACKAIRTGTYSVVGNQLQMSYSGLTCIPNNCTTDYSSNGQMKTFSCPGTGSKALSTDGSIYAFSVDTTTLYLTPQMGSNTSCYYKYTKK